MKKCDNNNLNIDKLIELKLLLENDILTLLNSNKKAKTLKLTNTSDDLDIYAIFAIYENNIEIIGEELLTKQIELLDSINSVLSRKCNHKWIFNKNYCLKCFVKKNN